MAAPIRRTAEAMLDGAEGDAVMADKGHDSGIRHHRGSSQWRRWWTGSKAASRI